MAQHEFIPDYESFQEPALQEKFVSFTNFGEIDVRAITTFGVSAKSNENPIGYFGTGLKYAIAVLLRNNIAIDIYSGKEVYNFSVKKEQIRGKDFDFIYINDTSIGFTTDLGKNWELWQAFREIYSNCLDEKGESFSSLDNEIVPEIGKTAIIVQGDKFVEIFNTRSEYFIQDDPIFKTNHSHIHGGKTNNIFYRGIMVGIYKKPFLHKHNIQDTIILTEDRTIAYHHQVTQSLVNSVVSSDDELYIASVLTAPDGYFETDMDFTYKTVNMSEQFEKVVSELNRTKPDKMNRSSVQLVERNKKAVDRFKNFRPNKEEQEKLTKAIDFLIDAGYPVDDYPMVFVETLGENVLALAEDGKIVLTRKIFNMGTNMIALGVFEEWVHLKYNYDDLTRSMQSYLFEQIIIFAQKQLGRLL